MRERGERFGRVASVGVAVVAPAGLSPAFEDLSVGESPKLQIQEVFPLVSLLDQSGAPLRESTQIQNLAATQEAILWQSVLSSPEYSGTSIADYYVLVGRNENGFAISALVHDPGDGRRTAFLLNQFENNVYPVALEDGAELKFVQVDYLGEEDSNRIAPALVFPGGQGYVLGQVDSFVDGIELPPDTDLSLIETAVFELTQEGRVNVDSLNMRSGPSTGNEILSVLPNGASLDVLGADPDTQWLNVQTTEGQEGWVHPDFVQLGEPDISSTAVPGQSSVSGIAPLSTPESAGVEVALGGEAVNELGESDSFISAVENLSDAQFLENYQWRAGDIVDIVPTGVGDVDDVSQHWTLSITRDGVTRSQLPIEEQELWSDVRPLGMVAIESEANSYILYELNAVFLGDDVVSEMEINGNLYNDVHLLTLAMPTPGGGTLIMRTATPGDDKIGTLADPGVRILKAKEVFDDLDSIGIVPGWQIRAFTAHTPEVWKEYAEFFNIENCDDDPTCRAILDLNNDPSLITADQAFQAWVTGDDNNVDLTSVPVASLNQINVTSPVGSVRVAQ